ncbi:MAG: acetyl-CoA carboxylase carboxyl transferase subunit alpha, partial [Alphaproteobacteria bacterium]|nr:acetyl-CoA carboxylase carboxyl transferase subunit alpha [Alphaproteobacteria bacterium]
VISLVIGEGGSGGAIAIAVADRILMLEHSVYSVISPEGCASILWRDGSHATDAANALKLTAQDLLALEVIDEIVPEPVGAAHRDRDATIRAAGAAISKNLAELAGVDGTVLRQQRREKFLKMGETAGL